MKTTLFCLLVMGIVGPAWGFDHTHSKWEFWLSTYVVQKGATTQVDYAAAKKAPEPLKSYLNEIQELTSARYRDFSEKQKLAFLMNAYNAFTVDLIVRHYPVKSIKDLGGWFSTPWKKKFFKLFGEAQTLDGIEHGMIRAQFSEPRIHFAVNCASRGCPALQNHAFIAEKLDTQLEEAALRFLKDTERNRYDSQKKTLFLSKIFDWYGEDFKKSSGSVLAFVSPYFAKNGIPIPKDTAIEFLEYDWSLNGVTP